MGKNNKKKGGKSKGKSNFANIHNTNTVHSNNKNYYDPEKYPFVSVCTPTYNRRPFMYGMVQCFNHQTYPKERMEWIIIDDGTDKIEELVQGHPNIKYFKYDKKMSLGVKRNLMHEKSCGEIIVYMDDDDYYPPDRVSHAVQKLQENKEALCAGSSEIYIWFKHIQKMYQFGPYGENHATAGTFAFKRKLLEDSRYEEDACLAEEKAFLKDYTVPFVQLDPLKTILVFSHDHNTFDKKKLLDNPHPQVVKESNKPIKMFVKEEHLVQFFTNLDDKLKDYEPGKPRMKPDVLEQMVKIEEKRRKMAEEMCQAQIVINQPGKEPQKLNNEQVISLLQQQQQQILTLQQNGGNSNPIQTGITKNVNGKEIQMSLPEVASLLQQQQQQIQILQQNGGNINSIQTGITKNVNGKEIQMTLPEVASLLQQQQQHIQMLQSNGNTSTGVFKNQDGKQVLMTSEEVTILIKQQQEEIERLKKTLLDLENNVNYLNKEILKRENQIFDRDSTILDKNKEIKSLNVEKETTQTNEIEINMDNVEKSISKTTKNENIFIDIAPL
tara:strand:- start:778 stop:2436 length:1659 start_codon:yes stop_codon:yes gene_type:complete